MKSLRFLVIGAGGVGGYYGGLLGRAGHQVTMFARGANADALRERGAITVRTPDESFLAPVALAEDVSNLPEADVALLAVKYYSLPAVAPVVRAAAERGALVVPFLNGVTVGDALAAAGVPRTQLLGGLTRISAARVAPGVVERLSPFQAVVLGELDGAVRGRSERIVRAFGDVGVDARLSTRIEVELWDKFVFITAMAAVCGLARTSIGHIRGAPLGARTIGRAVDEVIAVARARGIPLPEDEGTRVRAMLESLPPAMKPSLLLDLEAGGPTELDALSGAVVRFATEAGLEVPFHETVVTVLAAAVGREDAATAYVSP